MTTETRIAWCWIGDHGRVLHAYDRERTHPFDHAVCGRGSGWLEMTGPELERTAKCKDCLRLSESDPMTDPTPSKEAAPLTPEEEAALRERMADDDPVIYPSDIDRLLATLDAARASQPAPADPEWQYPVPGVAVKSPAPAGVRDPEPVVMVQDFAETQRFYSDERARRAAGVRDPKPRPDLAAALRLSADRLHSLSQDLEHQRWTFDECPARYCVEARAALAHPAPKEPREDADYLDRIDHGEFAPPADETPKEPR